MKLRILSDLHIEFHPFTIPRTEHDAGSVLILAGDIGVIHRRAELESFLRSAAGQFRAVIYVLGNHEFYRGIWPDAKDDILGWSLPDNVYLLERQWVQIDDIIFVGATLWTDFDGDDLSVMLEAERTLHDFHYISVHGTDKTMPRAIGAEMMLQDHKQSLSWLYSTLNEVQAQGKRCVLVTHHGVSRLSIHESYRDDPLNGAFVSDCTHLLEQTRPELVIHGHVHNSFDYVLGSTRVVVNPRGYTRTDDSQENPAFDPFFTIDLGA